MAISSVNLSALKSGADTFSNLISATKKQKYGYTPVKGLSSTAPETLYFTIEGEQSISFESDITDHYVESNEAIQDHVALRPVQIQTSSYVGEVTNKIDGPLGEFDHLIEEKLTVVNQYLPKVTAYGTQLLNTAKQAIAVAKKTKDAVGSAWDKIRGKGSAVEKMTKQQEIYNRFYTYWKNRTLFLVRTPWAQYDNCVIQSFRSSQGAETENVSVFDVTFKQLRFVRAYNKGKIRSGRNATQAGGKKNLGASTPAKSKSSWTDKMSKYASNLWSNAKGMWSA